jgi:replication factor A1
MEKPPWYNACPTESCNKKVTLNEASGLWQCEKCDKGFPAPNPRYILSLLCCDSTGMSWLTAFDNVAQTLLKAPAKEVDDIKKEGSQEKFDAVFKKALFQTCLFKIRAKAELRDDEMRQRAHIISASPLNFKEESQNLLDQIAAY